MATFLARTAVRSALRNAQIATPVQVSAVIIRRDFTFSTPIINSPIESRLKLVPLIPTQRKIPSQYIRFLSFDGSKSGGKSAVNDEKSQGNVEVAKLTLFQRFKQMYRDYWYVLVPVHLITSAGWFGTFYYMAKSGIDVVAIMESYNISAKLISPLKDSSLGYVAIAYAMYKIATPIRYTVTLGGTTISISYLQKFGYIKPVPTREQLKEMYNTKREYMIDTVKDKREELRLKKEQLKDRTDNLIDDMERKIVTKINDTKKKTTNTIPKP